MKNLVSFWFKTTRAYSLPMSIMSWSVPFVFGITDKGNILYGRIALIGIIFAHLGVNMFDDFVDFLIAKKNANAEGEIVLQKGKCAYLLNKELTLKQLALVICVLFTLAVLCGLYLTVKTGFTVVIITAIAGVIGLLYPLLSFVALGEIAVGVIFAPLLYTGVYYVMTGGFSLELFPVAISTGILTIGLLHAHMFLDIDYDKPNNKRTLCLLAGSKENAVRNQLYIMALGYINIIAFVLMQKIANIYLITLLSLPTAVMLYKIMRAGFINPDEKIHTNIFFGILENMQEYKENRNFMITFMTARNVMVEFTILVCLAKVISEII